MGRTPADIRSMTPAETDLLVRSWNAAQAESGPAAPSDAEFEELVKNYG